MKKQIRRGVFETNSSSMHSLSIHRMGIDTPIKYDDIQDDDNMLHIKFGEFGWGYERYSDSYHKLQYALTMVFATDARDAVCADDFYNTEGFKVINELIKDKFNCDGIVIEDRFEIHSYYRRKWDDEKRRWVEDKNDLYVYLTCDGYIDHQSCEDYSSLQDFLNSYGITLEDFIFDPGIELIIDNDNH